MSIIGRSCALWLMVCPVVALSQWQWIAPYPPRLQAYSATVVGDRAYFWSAENLVLATLDGGQTFDVSQYTPMKDVALGCCNGHGIAFADSLIGYITDIAYGQFRTTDAGRHWTLVGNPYSGLEMVEFGSNTVGWKVGEGGTQRTTDAGVSWFPAGQLYSSGGIFSNVYALNQNQVWVMKSYYGGRNPTGLIWYSQNSGSTWTNVDIGITSQADTQITCGTMRMNGSGIGFAVGSMYHPSSQVRQAFVLKTTNLGTRWACTTLPDEQWGSIVSISDSVWVIFGNSGSYPNVQPIVRRTTDMGETWILSSPFSYGNYNSLSSAAYIKPSHTIVVTTLQGIYESWDAGQTYARLTSDRDLVVTDVILEKHPPAANEQMVIAKTTYSPSYLLSTDGGTSWQHHEIPQSVGSEIWGTRIVDGQIFIITNQIRLYRSVDRGSSWSQIYVPSSGALRALDVYDRNHLALQGFPNIVSSSDGGSTWSRGPFPGTMWLNETAMVDSNEIVAVGGFYDSLSTRGVIYHTADRGLNWRIEDTPNEMLQVTMVSEDIGFAMGTNRLYKTTNSGASWSTSCSATSYTFNAFCFENLTHGLLSESYFTLETVDGGYSWHQVELGVPLWYEVYRMAFNARGDLFVASHGRLIIGAGGGGSTQTKPSNTEITKPTLQQNYPNPFNPTTTIHYALPHASFVKLTVYNTLGQQVAQLLNEQQQAGYHEVVFRGDGLASGVYFYRLDAGSYTNVKKLLLLK